MEIFRHNIGMVGKMSLKMFFAGLVLAFGLITINNIYSYLNIVEKIILISINVIAYSLILEINWSKIK